MPQQYAAPLKFLVLLALFALVLSPTSSSMAQSVRGQDSLEIQVSPEAPAPGARTTVTLSSMSLDLSRATISWTLDGSPLSSGAGERSATFTMGPAGRTTIIGVTIAPVQGSRITRTFTFRPASVLLLWEADTYTPPLYRGQALYSPGAGIRILAIPAVVNESGTPIPANELTFKWQMGGDAYADRSGLGRDVLLLSGSQLRSGEEIGVTVLRRDGSRAAEAVTIIPAAQPLVRFYKVDPLRGTRWERTLSGEVALTDTETTVVAEPYFLTGTSKSTLGFTQTWRLNGAEVAPEGRDQSAITLRQQGGAGGVAHLEYSIQSNSYEKLLQSASAALTLTLSSGSSSIF